MKTDKEQEDIFDEIKVFSSEDEKLKFLGEVLSNESSRKIFLLLTTQKMTANDIAKKLELRLSLVIHHLNKMIQIDIIQISEIGKNTKNHNIKYYSAKQGMLILPKSSADRATKSETLSTALTRILKFASVGVAGVTSWFTIRYIQFQQNIQGNSDQLGYEYVEERSFEWFTLSNEILIPVIITSAVVVLSSYLVSKKFRQ